MYRFLLTPRWIGIHLFCLALIPLMVWLGFWQWHRYEHAHRSNQLQSRNLAAPPADYASVAPPPGHRVGQELWWRRVKATGHYDTEHEMLARRRMSNNGDVGYDVLTPLVTAKGDTVLVNRGWVAQPDDPKAAPKVPPVPKGTVTVTGRLHADEGGGRRGIGRQLGLPADQVMEMNGQHLAKAAGFATPLPGFMELTSTSPKPAATPEVPSLPDGSNTGLHVAYTLNWWVFVLGVPIAWWRLLVHDREERRKAAAAGAAPDPKADGDAAKEPADAAR